MSARLQYQDGIAEAIETVFLDYGFVISLLNEILASKY